MATQAERRAGTRRALLDAAAELLVDEGLVGFTTGAVTSRSGLSNGALFSHFPTRLELLAATVEHVLSGLRDGYETTFAGLIDTGASPATLLELLWESMNDTRFAAVLGVYTQARTDPDLFLALNPIVVKHGSFVGQINRKVVRSFVHDVQQAEEMAGLGTIAILAMQGLAVSHMVGASMNASRALIDTFADLLEMRGLAASAQTPAEPCADPSADGA
jgi:AcrR family transcriptional regulator